jgi:hypothetical protein
MEGHDEVPTVNDWFVALATNLLPDNDEAFGRSEPKEQVSEHIL